MTLRDPFWHRLLRMIAYAVIIAFAFCVIASSIYTVLKVIPT